MIQEKKFDRDFSKAQNVFPKLKASWDSKNQCWFILGEIDICDVKGEYWGSFDILIHVPKSYPYCLPTVKEVSSHIKRIDDWHINNDGVCCFDVEHKMLLYAKRGINILNFLKDYVYPYFANQLYKFETKKYAGEEYKHHFEGIKQFYSEDLNIQDAKTAVLILEAVLKNDIPGRNAKCICLRDKFKKCHLSTVDFLMRLPRERLRQDLDEFMKIVSS